MKTRSSFIFISLLIVSITACKSTNPVQDTSSASQQIEATGILNQTTKTGSFYFRGELSLHNDTAYLKECATEARIPIKSTEITTEITKQYKAIHKNNIIGIFRGYLTPMEDSKKLHSLQLTITEFVRWDTLSTCNPQKQLTGEYTTFIPNRSQPTDKFTFTLYPDHTYKFLLYNLLNNSSREAAGNWNLQSDTLLVFDNSALANSQNEAYINYTNMSLVFKTSKRVYQKNSLE